MDIGMILARVLHIGLGVFWAGAMIFMAAYVTPSLRDAGPDAAKVVAGFAKRRLLDVMPAAALVTVLSGLYLYWRVSAGWDPGYMGSPAGMAIGTGGLLGLAALGLGLSVVRPSMKRAIGLGESAGAAPAEQREGLMAEAQTHRMRAAGAGKAVAWLLAGATITMAVARYL